MYKKIIPVIFLLFTCNALIAQVTISGTVKDSTGKGIPSVSVTLKKKNGIILSFAITNAGGVYKIKNEKATVSDTLFIEANAMGYRMQKTAVKGAEQVYNFEMVSTSTRLPDVTVQNKRSLLKREGDTLNYDVASFSNKQDRTIGDVIKKLPGVEVADNGQISYGGKPINRFYVDGDNLLDGKYNLATSSIPNDAVSKVQVLENHQPIKALKKLEPSESAAMNIVLKDKARIRLMGTGSAALGTPNVYNFSANAMLFQKQVKFINNLKFNNSGNDLADENYDFFGSMSHLPPNLLSAGGGGSPALQKKRYLFNNAAMATVNDMLHLKNEYELRINASYMLDKQFQSSQFSSAYFLPNDTIRYAEKQHAGTSLHSFSTQFTLTANKENYYLSNITKIDNTVKGVAAGLETTTNSNINQDLNNTTTNISNNFSIVGKSDRGNVLRVSSFINYVNNPASLYVTPGLYEGRFNNGSPFAALIQDASVPTFYTDNSVGFGKTKQRFQQQYKIGFSYEQQQLKSMLFAEQYGGQKAVVSDSFVNHLDWSRLKAYVQAEYTYTTNLLMMQLVLPVNFQDTKYTGRVYQNHLSNFPVSPSFWFRYNTGRESTVNLRYQYGNSWANIGQVYDGFVMTGYRSFYANGDILNETQSHTISADYKISNTLKIFFFTMGGSYFVNRNSTINDTRLSTSTEQSNLIPYQNVSNSTQLYTSISKYIFPLSTTIGAGVRWSRSIGNQLQNGDLLRLQNDGWAISTQLNSKLTSWLSLGYKGAYNIFSNKYVDNSHLGNTGSPVVKNQVHNFDMGLNFTSNFYGKVGGENYHYHLPGSQDNDFTIVDASFTYKIDKLRTDIELSMTNIAGVDTYANISVSANSIVESRYQIRPRMVMLKTYFRF